MLKSTRIRVVGGLSSVLLGAMLIHASLAQAGPYQSTQLASRSAGGAYANHYSTTPGISRDGHFVAFSSMATNLVAPGTSGQQIFRKQMFNTGEVKVISMAPGGSVGNGASQAPSMSRDGRYVAFQSMASNLVPNDTNGFMDVFVRDVDTNTTRRVSIGAAGGQASAGSKASVISGDGNLIVFESNASNLVDEDTNNASDIFLHNLVTGTTTRISVGPSGEQATAGSANAFISDNGDWIAYESFASNLVPGDTAQYRDIFLLNRISGITSEVSVGLNGAQANGHSATASVSNSGSVAFMSSASNIWSGDTNGVADVFIRPNGFSAAPISWSTGGEIANAESYSPAISSNGANVAFASGATNLVPGDSNGAVDVFLRTLWDGSTTRESVDSQGNEANGWSGSNPADPYRNYTRVAINVNLENLDPGPYLAFTTNASNLWPYDQNGWSDIAWRRPLS